MPELMDAKVVATKIKAAIEELREGAQSHLDELQAEHDEADRQAGEDPEVEPDYSSEDEMNQTQQIIDELDEVIAAFEDKIIPLLRQG